METSTVQAHPPDEAVGRMEEGEEKEEKREEEEEEAFSTERE